VTNCRDRAEDNDIRDHSGGAEPRESDHRADDRSGRGRGRVECDRSKDGVKTRCDQSAQRAGERGCNTDCTRASKAHQQRNRDCGEGRGGDRCDEKDDSRAGDERKYDKGDQREDHHRYNTTP